MPPPESSPGSSETEAIDPVVEIEALRSLLAEAVTRSVKLLSAMKNYRRQRKAIESAWSSLQQLKLGTGG